MPSAAAAGRAPAGSMPSALIARICSCVMPRIDSLPSSIDWWTVSQPLDRVVEVGAEIAHHRRRPRCRRRHRRRSSSPCSDTGTIAISGASGSASISQQVAPQRAGAHRQHDVVDRRVARPCRPADPLHRPGLRGEAAGAGDRHVEHRLRRGERHAPPCVVEAAPDGPGQRRAPARQRRRPSSSACTQRVRPASGRAARAAASAGRCARRPERRHRRGRPDRR